VIHGKKEKERKIKRKKMSESREKPFSIIIKITCWEATMLPNDPHLK
jgi:hypothetical protein